MKKMLSLLLCFSLLLPLFGCGKQSGENSVRFYYRSIEPDYGSEEGVLDYELHSRPASMKQLFEDYFSGPKSRSLEMPFPRGTDVISWSFSNDTLLLNMSEPFASLSGMDLILACSCITRTFLELFDVNTVTFQVMHQTLNGRKFLELGRSNLRFSDDSLDQIHNEFLLYYVDPRWRYLIGTEVSVSLADPEDIARFLVLKLMSNPYNNSDLVAPIPSGTKLLDVNIKNEVCTVDFSREFETHVWSRPEAQRLTLLSLANTLTQIDGIRQVEFCTEGNLLVQYGALTISAPYVAEDRAIGSLADGFHKFDATIYVSNGPGDCLIGIPSKIRQTAGTQPEERILEELIHTPSLNGFYTTIPSGTTIRSIQTIQGTCHIDLSPEFLSNPATLEQSVRAIVASVCTVADVDRAQITVNGHIPTTVSASLFEVLTPQSDWFG